jgi:CRISPR-associated protein Csy1
MNRSLDLAVAQSAFAARDFALARKLAASLVETSPGLLTAQALLANACNALGKFAEAVAALDVLHHALPSDVGIRRALAMACNNAGSQVFQNGDLDAAAVLYARAIDLDPANALASTNLAACATQLRQHAAALDCWERLLRLDATNFTAALGRARASRALGREAEADLALNDLASQPSTPENSLALALEFERVGQPQRAAQIRAAAALDDDPAACAQLAALEKICGNLAAARSHLLRVAEEAMRRNDARTQFRAERDAALLVGSVFVSREEIVAVREDYLQRLHTLIKAWPPARLAQIGAHLDDLKHTHFSMAYQGADDRQVATLYGDWLSAAASALAQITQPPATGQPIRRIGVVCARWTRGTVAAYFGSWIDALRATGAEVHLYTLSGQEDETSQALAARSSQSQRLPSDLHRAAQQLCADRLDLLLYPEIGLDAACEVLAALRLAPRQWVAWGHPVTTGLPTIDRFLSVAAMEPDDAARDYREELSRLPGIGTAYARPPNAPADRAGLGLPLDAPIYLLPHSPLKLHPDSDDLIAGILRRDGAACVVFVADELPALTLAHRRRLENRLTQLEIAFATRLRWLPRLAIDDFRKLLASVDVVIDTLHFSGGNTSLDALAQNTPIVTVEGRHMRGRQTAAMLRMIDLPQLICLDADATAACAVALVRSTDERASVRESLVERTPRLFDQHEPLQALRDLIASA